MRTLLLSLIFVLSGCAGKPSTSEKDWNKYYSSRAPSSVSRHACIATSGPNCKAKVMWRCPSGFVDGCYTPGSTGKHECVTRESGACSVKADVTCPEGFADGCLTGTSLKHECVVKVQGASCEQEAETKCPQNFHDVCDDGDGDEDGV